MHDVTMETRISILEHDVLGLLEMKTQMRETHEKVFELSVLLKAHTEKPECSAPNSCIALLQRLESLELKSAEAKGGWKVAAGVTAVATGALGWLWNHFANTKHP